MDYVSKSVFLEHSRFTIYHDSLFEQAMKQGSMNIIKADYGIDHRIVKKDLLKEFSVTNGYVVPFLHSGKSVNKYALKSSSFHWAKIDHQNPINYDRRFLRLIALRSSINILKRIIFEIYLYKDKYGRLIFTV